MNILIVDDSNDKIASIVSVITQVSSDLNIDTVVDIYNAIIKLKEVKYDLLISDILLPTRQDSEPIKDGGHILLKEIYRNGSIKTPAYIIAITQYVEFSNDFSNVWSVLHYDQSKPLWKASLVELIGHIIRLNNHQMPGVGKKPTIFVEGSTDRRIVELSVELFFPKLKDQLLILSAKGGGASWVARQIIIWANLLNRNSDNEYVKAVALLDGDDSGKASKEEISRKIERDSAGSRTFKVIQLSSKYCKQLIPLIRKGISVPISLEEMLSLDCWIYAHKNDWLDARTDIDNFLTDPKKWDKMSVPLLNHINSLGLSETEKIFLKRVKYDCKGELVKYIVNLDRESQMKALANFQILLQEIIEYLLSDNVSN